MFVTFLNISDLLTIVLCFLMIRSNVAADLNCKNHQETIREFHVSSTVKVGEGTTLRCLFGGSTGKLVNLKWYVNDTEFYRYEPGTRSHVKIFRVKGVKIDESKTQFDAFRGSIIGLNNLTYSSSGFYKCEVTTEPCFETTEKRKRLTVVSQYKGGISSLFGSNGSSKLAINSFNSIWFIFHWFLLVYSILSP